MDCRDESAAVDFRFCPDTPQVAGDRLRALVTARVIDEITRLPIERCRVTTPDPTLALHVAARSATGGVVGLAGRPARLFPDLAATGAPVPMLISADGYLPRPLPGTLGPIAGFPTQFAPLDHGDVVLHRVGVTLTGRVTRRGTPANLPLAGADVRLDGLWSNYLPAGAAPGPLMEPPRVVALLPGLYADYAAATLSRCDLVPAPAQAKALLQTATPGTRRLRLANRETLVAGMPLLIDPTDPDRRELIGIATIDASYSPDQPAWIELDHPLRHLHRGGVQAVPTAIPATHDPRTLARLAQTGDPLAFLTADPPWAAGTVVKVDDALRPVEYQWVERYQTVADADGYFRLPKLSRVALVRLRASHPARPTPLLTVIEPDYGRAQQNLALAFE